MDDEDRPFAVHMDGEDRTNRVFNKRGGVRPPYSPDLAKYWHQRHALFSRFDFGVRLDTQSWYSVTPEGTAIHTSRRLDANLSGGSLFVDAFAGVGGNAIQQARLGRGLVLAIDIDPLKVAMARHNAKVYGVQDKIQFLVGDFLALAPRLRADVVFLSPPWGGVDYAEMPHFPLEGLEPCGTAPLVQLAIDIAPQIGLFLPRNVQEQDVKELVQTMPSHLCEFQRLVRPSGKGKLKPHAVLVCLERSNVPPQDEGGTFRSVVVEVETSSREVRRPAARRPAGIQKRQLSGESVDSSVGRANALQQSVSK